MVDVNADDADDTDEGGFLEMSSGWDALSVALGRCTVSIKMQSLKSELAVASVLL